MKWDMELDQPTQVPQYDTKLVPKNLYSLREQVRENNFDKT